MDMSIKMQVSGIRETFQKYHIPFDETDNVILQEIQADWGDDQIVYVRVNDNETIYQIETDEEHQSVIDKFCTAVQQLNDVVIAIKPDANGGRVVELRFTRKQQETTTMNTNTEATQQTNTTEEVKPAPEPEVVSETKPDTEAPTKKKEATETKRNWKGLAKKVAVGVGVAVAIGGTAYVVWSMMQGGSDQTE